MPSSRWWPRERPSPPRAAGTVLRCGLDLRGCADGVAVSAHTPGPWVAVFDMDERGAEVETAPRGFVEGSRSICNCSPEDALLIAAAPDLLEALKNCAEQLQTFRGAGRLDEPSGQPSWTELDEVRLWESREALRKAGL